MFKKHQFLAIALRSFSRLSLQPNKLTVATSDQGAIFKSLKDGSTVAIQGVASTPVPLIEDFCKYVHANNLKNIKIISLLPFGDAPYFAEPYAKHFETSITFSGPNARKAVNSGVADYIPIFLNDVPRMYRNKVIKLDMALINVSPPDKHGYYSLGPSIESILAAIEMAKVVVAQVNPLTPITYGDALLHKSRLDFVIEKEMPMHRIPVMKPSPEEETIGRLIADNLVPDGATLQMGIGSIPDVVLANLLNHKNLGIHTEMFSDGLIDLVASGAITNSEKALLPGYIVSSFIIGTERIYDYINHNQHVIMKDVQWTNLPENIAKNPNVVAINSCIEIDLTGQVVSDSIGTKIYSGFGGQFDFIRGAAMATDDRGKPIIAMVSRTGKGDSKIKAALPTGAGIVTPAHHVHYVVTEFGIANLFGKNLRQRAHSLIQLAHPDFREELEKNAYERLQVMPSPN